MTDDEVLEGEKRLRSYEYSLEYAMSGHDFKKKKFIEDSILQIIEYALNSTYNKEELKKLIEGLMEDCASASKYIRQYDERDKK